MRSGSPLGLAIAVAALLATVVAACGSSGDATTVAPAKVKAGRYRTFVEVNTQHMVRALQAMLPEIEAGEVSRAESRYSRARVYYSQIEPASEMFGALDKRIDGLEGEVSAADFGGFHRIEKALFLEETTKGMTPVAKRLLDDAKSLEPKLQTARFSAGDLVDGVNRILGQIVHTKLAGLEEPYSQTALVDVSGNLEAAGAALDALQPTVIDPEQWKELSTRLEHAFSAIETYGFPARNPDQPRQRSPGAVFTAFEELSPAEVNELRGRLEALAEPVAQLRDQIAAAQG